MTFALPGDTPPVTVEVIVLAPEIFDDEDHTAGRMRDVPELAEEGWLMHEHYGVACWVRTIG